MTTNGQDDSTSLLIGLNIVSSTLSLVGSSIMCYFCYKVHAKTTSIKLVFAIGISDFLLSIANVMSIFSFDGYQDMCRWMLGPMRQFFLNISWFLGTSIPIYHYKITDPSNSLKQSRFFVITAVVVLLLSFSISIVPLIFMENISYVNSNTICIALTPTMDSMVLLFWFALFQGLELVLGLIISLTGYLLTARRIERVARTLMYGNKIRTHKLIWYMAATFIVFIPSAIIGLLESSKITIPDWAKALQIVLMQSLGFINSLVYGLQRNIYKPAGLKTAVELPDPHNTRFDTSQEQSFGNNSAQL